MPTPQELAAAALARLHAPVATIPTALGNDAAVNTAYQKLMNYQAGADQNVGTLSRKLSTNIDMSQQNRGHSIQNADQGLSDRGLLNSGIALKRNADLNTQYDTTDRQMTNNYTDALAGMDRTSNDYLQQYQDSQVQASHRQAQAQADAQAATLAQQQQNQAAADQQALLLAAIGQSSYQPPAISITTPTATPAALASVAIKKAVASSVKAVTQPKLVVHGGPQ